jgi:hypothetical protein
MNNTEGAGTKKVRGIHQGRRRFVEDVAPFRSQVGKSASRRNDDATQHVGVVI